MTEHPEEELAQADPSIHFFGKHRLPRGFILLWKKDVVLRYRFNERTLRDTTRTKDEIFKLYNKVLEQWGDAAPVTFIEDDFAWDIEFYLRKDKNCFREGCS
ncbi:hypothetical protein BGZ72_007665 [Mortierella alpina]|nr:hypothetical protein BGZ72_007665 [Mortierella alpina]